MNNKFEKLNDDSSHDEPCKIGQPPNSLLTIDMISATPSDSIADSSIHELYKRRALLIDGISIVLADNGNVKIS